MTVSSQGHERVQLAACSQGQTHPDYCLVVGEIAPVDMWAPNIAQRNAEKASWMSLASARGCSRAAK
jgi:hypothetical protein